jgi:GT2 family glycosyltransferase
MSKITVIAAIPNFNMATGLAVLLPQLLKEKYDAIYVLDDASTDNSEEVVKKYKKVTFVKGLQNVGAGANRNRILQFVSDNTIIHFLDADVELKSKDVVTKIKAIHAKYPNSVVGGTILNKSSEWHNYNFGPKGDLKSFIGVRIHWVSILLMQMKFKKSAKRIRRMFHFFVDEWPDITSKPKSTTCFWVTEGNLIMPAKLFSNFGGFNESLREHEILEFGYRLQKLGKTCYFDPSITLLHTALRVRPAFRFLIRGWNHIKVLKIERNNP